MALDLGKSAHRPLVLLFYDGFERQARRGFLPRQLAQVRRLARHLYRTVRRRQVRTGIYTAFIGLRTALERAGCDVRVNDFAAARSRPGHPIGLAGYRSVFSAVDLPNPRVLGPADMGSPADAAVLASDPRTCAVIQPSDWSADYFRRFCGDKVETCFSGIDCDQWPDLSHRSKSVDVLIYDKIHWARKERVPLLIGRLVDLLREKSLSYRILRYGEHLQSVFRNSLGEAKCMVFLSQHETQGIAYQEALASGVPVLAWDEGVAGDRDLIDIPPGEWPITSVPYFDSRCGARFKQDAIVEEFNRFWQNLAEYALRDYVIENLSIERSAQAYLEIYDRCRLP